RLEWEVEQLRAECEQMALKQRGTLGDVVSSDSSVTPRTPVKLGPLDSTASEPLVTMPYAKRLDRRSAGIPPAGAENVEGTYSQSKHTWEREHGDECDPVSGQMMADRRSGTDNLPPSSTQQSKDNSRSLPQHDTTRPPAAVLLGPQCTNANCWARSMQSPKANQSTNESDSATDTEGAEPADTGYSKRRRAGIMNTHKPEPRTRSRGRSANNGTVRSRSSQIGTRSRVHYPAAETGSESRG